MKFLLDPVRRMAAVNGSAVSQSGPPSCPNRSRRAIMVSGLALMLPVTHTSSATEAAQNKSEVIVQPAVPDEKAFLQRAFDMRRKAIDYGDQAYGAVIVRDRIIIGESWSRVVLDNDPTGHAEMSAIRDAARRLGSRELSGAVIYSSSRPCPMCEAAAFWAGITQMVHGRGATNAGSPQLHRC